MSLRFFRIGVGGHREVKHVLESKRQNQEGSVTVVPAYTRNKATPPTFAVGGVGLDRAVTRRLAVFTEIDLILGANPGLGLRASAGMLMPLLGIYRER